MNNRITQALFDDMVVTAPESLPDINDTELSGSEIARGLTSIHVLVSGRCAVCGNQFLGDKRRKYCSGACRQRAWYSSHKNERKVYA